MRQSSCTKKKKSCWLVLVRGVPRANLTSRRRPRRRFSNPDVRNPVRAVVTPPVRNGSKKKIGPAAGVTPGKVAGTEPDVALALVANGLLPPKTYVPRKFGRKKLLTFC